MEFQWILLHKPIIIVETSINQRFLRTFLSVFSFIVILRVATGNRHMLQKVSVVSVFFGSLLSSPVRQTLNFIVIFRLKVSVT